MDAAHLRLSIAAKTERMGYSGFDSRKEIDTARLLSLIADFTSKLKEDGILVSEFHLEEPPEKP